MSIHTALVVDDSRSARYILQRLLERRQIRVELADSAQQAFAYLRSHRPDVVFMDDMMPGMEGQEAVDRLGADPHTATIPIIMYTGRDYLSDAAEPPRRGVIGVLSKPFTQDDVNALLARADAAAPRERPEPPRLMRVRDTAAHTAGQTEAAPTGKTPPRMQSLDRLRIQLAEELKSDARLAVEQLLGEELESQVAAQIERHAALLNRTVEQVRNEQTRAQAQLVEDRLPRLLELLEQRLEDHIEDRIKDRIGQRLQEHATEIQQRLSQCIDADSLTPMQRAQVVHIARSEAAYAADRPARLSARRAAAEFIHTDISALNLRLDRLRRRFNNLIAATAVGAIAVGAAGYLLGSIR